MKKVHINSLVSYFQFLLCNRRNYNEIKRILKHLTINDLEVMSIIIENELLRREKKDTL